MQNTINSDLIRGNINTIILKALFEGDRYGYDIIKEIEQKSGGQYVLKQPTLYSCLKRLEVQGFIRSYWGAKSIGGRRKYYTLTDMGRECFITSQTEWEYSRTVIDKLISERTYDLSKAEAEFKAASAQSGGEENEEKLDEESYNGLEEADEDENKVQPYIVEEEVEEEIEEVTAQQEAAATVEAPPAEPQEYLNTAKILDELFKRQEVEADDSYTEKLSEPYTAAAQKPPEFTAATYFNDYTEEDEEESEAQSPPASAPPPQEDDNQFIKYNSEVVYDNDENQRVLERDYKNVLSKLVKNQSAAVSVPDAEPNDAPPAVIPTTKQMEVANQSLADALSEKPVLDNADIGGPASAKFNDLASSFKEIGDNIYIREHSTAAAKEHAGKLYYLPYRLMLVQYGALFGIMAGMILLTFLLSTFGLGLRVSTLDLYIYSFAFVTAVAFPITAAILNLKLAEKKKRVNYNLKVSVLYRTIIFINCLVITYCVNIYLGMPLGFAQEHFAALLLPALFALCFPISTVIFSALFKSGKYSA